MMLQSVSSHRMEVKRGDDLLARMLREPGVLTEDLLAACKDNDTKRAQDLLAEDVLPGYSDPESGWTCLHWSVHNGNPVLTQALIRAGAAAEYKRASAAVAQEFDRLAMDTPLHWSAYRGDLGITWILLKEGYSPNDLDKMGNTATHLATANGHERVLDALIQDGADVHIQNKFKNTPFDVANSPECLKLLRNAKAMPAPFADEAKRMHTKNMQRILEAENALIEVAEYIEAKDDERSRQDRQQHLHLENKRSSSGSEGDEEQPGSRNEDHDDGRDDDEQGGNGPRESGEVGNKGERSGAENLERKVAADDLLPETKDHRSKAEEKEKEDGVEEGNETGEDGTGHDGTKGRDSDPCDEDINTCNNETEGDLLGQVERIREAIASAEALCICEDLVAAAAVTTSGPVLTQEVYTTVVNRLRLLLKRADGNPRIPRQLKKRAKALVNKSHAEYWLQVTRQRLLKVECGEARYLADMAKLETCINIAVKFGAQADLVCDSRLLLERLTSEVDINTAIESFPAVRLPIEVMPKDYWQLEDVGHIEETEGFPRPPVDAAGKTLDYVWIPSDSLRSLSAACEKMSKALVGAEGLNPTLVERGIKKLQEHQREVRILQEKDAADREKAVASAKKSAKKLKKKKGKKGKKK